MARTRADMLADVRPHDSASSAHAPLARFLSHAPQTFRRAAPNGNEALHFEQDQRDVGGPEG